MIFNKKGLSTVVTTLIIILLVLVAVGIVWVVVQGVLDEGVKGIETGASCIEINVRATAVVNTTGTNYDVTLVRSGSGGVIGGVKMVFSNASGGASDVKPLVEAIDPLATITRTIDGDILGANQIKVTPYFIDSSGNDQLCGGQTATFNF